MKRETYLEKIGQLSLEIREADRQIMGLVNLKKQKNAEIDRLNNLMVEEARSGTLYKEDEEHGDSCVDFGGERQRKEYKPAEL